MIVGARERDINANLELSYLLQGTDNYQQPGKLDRQAGHSVKLVSCGEVHGGLACS